MREEILKGNLGRPLTKKDHELARSLEGRADSSLSGELNHIWINFTQQNRIEFTWRLMRGTRYVFMIRLEVFENGEINAELKSDKALKTPSLKKVLDFIKRGDYEWLEKILAEQGEEDDTEHFYNRFLPWARGTLTLVIDRFMPRTPTRKHKSLDEAPVYKFVLGTKVRVAPPTKNHRLAVEEVLLGTVQAYNDEGVRKYFNYDYEEALKYAGVTPRRDPRWGKHPRALRKQGKALWILRQEPRSKFRKDTTLEEDRTKLVEAIKSILSEDSIEREDMENGFKITYNYCASGQDDFERFWYGQIEMDNFPKHAMVGCQYAPDVTALFMVFLWIDGEPILDSNKLSGYIHGGSRGIWNAPTLPDYKRMERGDWSILWERFKMSVELNRTSISPDRLPSIKEKFDIWKQKSYPHLKRILGGAKTHGHSVIEERSPSSSVK